MWSMKSLFAGRALLGSNCSYTLMRPLLVLSPFLDVAFTVRFPSLSFAHRLDRCVVEMVLNRGPELGKSDEPYARYLRRMSKLTGSKRVCWDSFLHCHGSLSLFVHMSRSL